MNLQKRTALAAACLFAACVPSANFAATDAEAQFPRRPVRLVVATPPSGGTDLIARLMAARLGERWGQTMVVDNRAGANGLIAFETVARAAPDGHSLVLGNIGHLLTAHLSGKLAFRRDGDFTPIALSATSVQLLVMHAGVPAKSVKEFVELARAAKPRHYTYASSGTGSIGHFAIELFSKMAKIEMTHVPYKGAGLLVPDLQSGQVQLAVTTVAAVLPLVQAGRLRGLALTGTKRVPAIPEVPTFAEAGYPRYDVSVWYGVYAPARMPAALTARLNNDFNWAVQQPEVAKRLVSAAIDPAGQMTAAQFADYTAAQLVTWSEGLTK